MKIRLYKQNLWGNYLMCLYNCFAILHFLFVMLWNFAFKVSSNLIFFSEVFKKVLPFKVRKIEMKTITLYLLSMLQERVPAPTFFFFLFVEPGGINWKSVSQ